MNKLKTLYYVYRDILLSRYWLWRSKNSNTHGLILMYHSIDDENEGRTNSCKHTKKEFISTIQRLKKEGYQFVSIASALEIIKNKNRLKFAVVTFDDVPEDVYHNAYPYLNEHNIPFALFVSQCYIDQPHFLTKDQIMEMDRNPLCTVGAHTLTHPFLRYSVNKGMELSESKRLLEEFLGHEILYMAYPYGKRQAVSHKIQRQAMRAGYRCAFGTINVPITDHTGKQLFYLPRVVIRN